MLINADGYWLKGLQSEDEWGFMFPDGAEKTLQNRFPQAAKVVMSNEAGAIALDQAFSPMRK